MDQLVLMLLQYGSAPALLVLAFAIGLMGKRLSDFDRKSDRRIQEMLAQVKEEISALERSLDSKVAKMDEAVDELARRVTVIERDYLPRQEHYRDFSGWREEIHRVVDRLDRLAEREKK